MLDIITSVISIGVIISLVITIISRFIPNDKLYSIGLKFGKTITTFCSNKLGCAVWDKIEVFLIEAFRFFLLGLHDGLRFDNEDEIPERNIKTNEKPKVRT